MRARMVIVDKKPDSCRVCDLSDVAGDCIVMDYEDVMEYKIRRHPDCPLVKITGISLGTGRAKSTLTYTAQEIHQMAEHVIKLA